MLRLYFDCNEGTSAIPCPECGQPLILGAERMGRLLAGYRGGFAVRPGKRVLLLCPSLDCHHREVVEIARTPADAVPFDCHGGAFSFRHQANVSGKTRDELEEQIRAIEALGRKSSDPRLPALRRFWVHEFTDRYWHLKRYVERAFTEGSELVCYLKHGKETGRVATVLGDGILLERSGGGSVFLRCGDMVRAAFLGTWGNIKPRFDFRDPDAPNYDCHIYHTPTRFVVIAGHTLELDNVSKYGICSVSSSDPEAARTLRLHKVGPSLYTGELPAAFVERCFRKIRYCTVRGYRMHLRSLTNRNDIVQLETRNMDAARALSMGRDDLIVNGARQHLYWYRFFHRDEIDGWEEIERPLRLPARRGVRLNT